MPSPEALATHIKPLVRRTIASAADPVPDFGPLAAAYDRLRPADRNWHELLRAIEVEGALAGRRVLDVGCGTGRVARALAGVAAEVVGVDPSKEMIAEARVRGNGSIEFEQASAEELPFRDGRFDRAVARLVVHLVDRPQAFVELRRVLEQGGRLVVATFRPEHFGGIWLARYFPSLASIDRARFPDPASLALELERAGFDELRVVSLTQRASVRRAEALERLRGRYISTLSLLPEDEYAAGLELADGELADETDYALEWALVVATRP